MKALGFGLFHLPNIFFGTGLVGLSQIVLAAVTGYALYLFRRWHGFIWVAMVAHGSWDISTFLSGNYGNEPGNELGNGLGFAFNILVAVASLVALVRSLRSDRTFTVTPHGVVPLAP